MSTSNSVTTLPLTTMEMGEIWVSLEGVLREHKFALALENLSDSQLEIRVQGRGTQTFLSISRQRHRMHEVQLSVDHNLTPSLLVRRKSENKSQGNGMFSSSYNWIWLFLIFGGIIITVLSNLAGGLLKVLDYVSPGWSTTQRVIGLLVIVAIVVAVWLLVLPSIKRARVQKAQRFGLEVLDISINHLQALNKMGKNTDTVRCWNCFEIISEGTGFCGNCGEKQS